MANREKARRDRVAAEKEADRRELDFVRQQEAQEAEVERARNEHKRRENLELQAAARDAIARKKAQRNEGRHEDPSQMGGMGFGESEQPARRTVPTKDELQKSWLKQIEERKQKRQDEHARVHAPSDEPFGKDDGAKNGDAKRRQLMEDLQRQIEERRAAREKRREESKHVPTDGMHIGEHSKVLLRCPATQRLLPPEAFNIPHTHHDFY